MHAPLEPSWPLICVVYEISQKHPSEGLGMVTSGASELIARNAHRLAWYKTTAGWLEASYVPQKMHPEWVCGYSCRILCHRMPVTRHGPASLPSVAKGYRLGHGVTASPSPVLIQTLAVAYTSA